MINSGALKSADLVLVAAAMGDRHFYRELSDHPFIGLGSAYVTHDPVVLRRCRQFRAINSVFEVDLRGRANSEAVGNGRQGGIGGLPDFARAASSLDDGLSILVLNARAGVKSRIVPNLSSDLPSLTDEEVDVVVTEYGSVNIRNLPAEDRARALISIAAPEHRGALAAAKAGDGAN